MLLQAHIPLVVAIFTSQRHVEKYQWDLRTFTGYSELQLIAKGLNADRAARAFCDNVPPVSNPRQAPGTHSSTASRCQLMATVLAHTRTNKSNLKLTRKSTALSRTRGWSNLLQTSHRTWAAQAVRRGNGRHIHVEPTKLHTHTHTAGPSTHTSTYWVHRGTRKGTTGY